MGQSGRGAAYAAVTAVAIWVATSIWPTFDDTVPRIYVGALGLALISGVLFLVGSIWKSASAQAAVTGIAIGAASLAVVGLATTQVVPVDGKANETLQAGGLIAILLVGLAFLFSDSAPTISWSRLPVITTLAAVVLVLAYGATIVYMLNTAGANNVTEIIWGRYLVIFTAVQGVGLAAIGALLGTQVKQGEVNAVTSDLKDALSSANTVQQAPPSDPNSAPPPDKVAAAAGRLEQLRVRYLE